MNAKLKDMVKLKIKGSTVFVNGVEHIFDTRKEAYEFHNGLFFALIKKGRK